MKSLNEFIEYSVYKDMNEITDINLTELAEEGAVGVHFFGHEQIIRYSSTFKGIDEFWELYLDGLLVAFYTFEEAAQYLWDAYYKEDVLRLSNTEMYIDLTTRIINFLGEPCGRDEALIRIASYGNMGYEGNYLKKQGEILTNKILEG